MQPCARAQEPWSIAWAKSLQYLANRLLLKQNFSGLNLFRKASPAYSNEMFRKNDPLSRAGVMRFAGVGGVCFQLEGDH